jgi:hypothetical protein
MEEGHNSMIGSQTSRVTFQKMVNLIITFQKMVNLMVVFQKMVNLMVVFQKMVNLIVTFQKIVNLMVAFQKMVNLIVTSQNMVNLMVVFQKMVNLIVTVARTSGLPYVLAFVTRCCWNMTFSKVQGRQFASCLCFLHSSLGVMTPSPRETAHHTCQKPVRGLSNSNEAEVLLKQLMVKDRSLLGYDAVSVTVSRSFEELSCNHLQRSSTSKKIYRLNPEK